MIPPFNCLVVMEAVLVVVLVVVGGKINANNANISITGKITKAIGKAKKAIKKGLNSLFLLLRPYFITGRDERI